MLTHQQIEHLKMKFEDAFDEVLSHAVEPQTVDATVLIARGKLRDLAGDSREFQIQLKITLEENDFCFYEKNVGVVNLGDM
jgi:hypothetical protein